MTSPWARGGRRHAVLGGLLLCCTLLLVACAAPPRPPGVLGDEQGSGAQALARQLAAISDDPAPRDARRVIFVGAALHSREDVFDRDIRAADASLRSVYGSAYRSVLLSNLRIAQPPRALPLASIDHLDDVFDALSSQRRPADRYIVLLTTHGGPGLLEVEQPARWQRPRFLTAAKLSSWVDQLGPQPTWLILSACFSGSHLTGLNQTHVMAMAASALDRPSFGCDDRSPNTWFVHELLGAISAGRQADPAVSLTTVWRGTVEGVMLREQAQKLRPSLPQMWTGPRMQERLDEPLRDF